MDKLDGRGQASGHGMRPPLEGRAVHAFRPQCGDDQFHDRFRYFRAAAGEDIHRRVAVFRPSVNGHVAFCDDHHTAHALGGKMMEMRGNQGSPTFFRAIAEKDFQRNDVVQNGRRTTGQFSEDVPSRWRRGWWGTVHQG